MKTFIVTVHNPDPGEQGLVTVLTPSGLIETRVVAAEHTDAFGDSHYISDLIRRMYPGKANKMHGTAELFCTDDHPVRYVAVYRVDCDDAPTVPDCGNPSPDCAIHQGKCD